jgi:hypothetical protein
MLWHTGADAFEIAPESELQESLSVVLWNRTVSEIKHKLAVDVGEIKGIRDTPLFPSTGCNAECREWGLEHELVKIRFGGDRVLDRVAIVIRRGIGVVGIGMATF